MSDEKLPNLPCEHEWRYHSGFTGLTMCERNYECVRCGAQKEIKTRMRDGGLTCGESKVKLIEGEE